MKKTGKILFFVLCGMLLIALFFHKQFFRVYYPQKYKSIVEQVTLENNLPLGLVYAVIHTESGFDPNAVSSVDARGLMQITEETFQWIQFRMGDYETTFEDLFHPEVNIKYGGWLLRLLLDEFYTVENVLCAYHAGWGSAHRWLKNKDYSPDGKNITNIPFPTTAHYQYKVLRALKYYEKLYKG